MSIFSWAPIADCPDKPVLLTNGTDHVVGHLISGDMWVIYVPGTPMLFHPRLTWTPILYAELPDKPAISPIGPTP